MIRRALLTTEEERFIREFILQWKLGKVNRKYFENKFMVDLSIRYGNLFRDWEERGDLIIDGDELRLTRDALLRVDSMLHDLFLPQHQDSRYA